MAHGITELDAGCVGFEEQYGPAWHGRKEYLNFPEEVPFREAVAAIGYHVEKKPLYLNTQRGFEQAPNAWALVNMRHENVLFTSVSDKFGLVQNATFLERIRDEILEPNKDALKLETVGSLFGGRVAFVNLLFGEPFQVDGDPSKVVSRLMFVNRFETASPSAGLTSTRIVCNNTWRRAETEAELNETLRRFMHTASCEDAVMDYVVDLAEMLAAREREVAEFDEWASVACGEETAEDILQAVFPNPEPRKDGEVPFRTLANLHDLRTGIKADAATSEEYGRTKGTMYALGQAVVKAVDHPRIVRGSDAAAVWYDGLWGRRDTVKRTAMATIRQTVAA